MIRFPIIEKLADWFKNNKPIYIIWVLTVGLLVGGGLSLFIKGFNGAEYIIGLGFFIWASVMAYHLLLQILDKHK